MGRSAHYAGGSDLDDSAMDEPGTLHVVEDELGDAWIEDWAADGVGTLEEYLAKHLAFLTYLDDVATAERPPGSPTPLR